MKRWGKVFWPIFIPGLVLTILGSFFTFYFVDQQMFKNERRTIARAIDNSDSFLKCTGIVSHYDFRIEETNNNEIVDNYVRFQLSEILILIGNTNKINNNEYELPHNVTRKTWETISSYDELSVELLFLPINTKHYRVNLVFELAINDETMLFFENSKQSWISYYEK